MKLKKLISLLLVGAMTATLAACGGGNNGADENKLVIWTLAADLEQFAERFEEKTGVECEVLVIQPADYPTKVQTALLGGETEIGRAHV